MLQGVPPATPSAAASLLLRKVLLTTAALPPGRSDRSFNALRLSKLLDGGFANDAADLATRIQAPSNPEILQLQADAFVTLDGEIARRAEGVVPLAGLDDLLA